MIETAQPSASSQRAIRVLRWAAYALVVLLGVGAALVFLRPHIYAGAVLQSPSEAPPLEGLVYTTGEPVDLTAFKGDVTMLYFGYTYCPDLCPTTLATVARAREQLGSKADRVHMVMVSVDPERDTPDLLGRYVRSFDSSFLGATGSAEALQQAEVLYGVTVSFPEGTDVANYTVAHTATLMLIDPDGYLRVLYPTGLQPEALASDVKELLG